MENRKLQELTRKLYEEGLSKGRTDADKLLADAREEARKIVAEAKAEAEAERKKAETWSQELRKNTMTEISLAGKQAVATLKEQIARMILAKSVAPAVADANLDAEFVKRMLLAVAGKWDGAASGKVSLEALLPAAVQAELGDRFAKSVKELLDAGIEVGYSDKVKSGFKIGEKEGGYYISFSDEDFDALLGEYLRDKVARILYGEE